MNQIQPNHTASVLNILLKLDKCAFQLFDDLMSRMECEVSKYLPKNVNQKSTKETHQQHEEGRVAESRGGSSRPSVTVTSGRYMETTDPPNSSSTLGYPLPKLEAKYL